MNVNYVIRQAIPQDGADVTNLFNHNPDGGRIAISAHYHQDPLYIATKLAPQTIIAVVQDTTTKQLLGSGMVRLEKNYQVDGIPRPTAVLNSLIVHHTHRRQGIAKALAQWRIEMAKNRLDDPLLVAGIQQGNDRSMAVVQNWAKAIIGPLQSCLVTTINKQPQADKAISIRWAQPSDLEEIVLKLNQFYREYLFFAPQTAQTLSQWLEQSPLSEPTRQYAVAIDGQGNIVAGLGITEQYRFMQMRVANMPLPLRLLNKVVGIVPADGYLKQSGITHFWFAPDQAAAARLLWQQIRWLVHHDTTHLTFFYDPRGPFPAIIQLPRWLPKSDSVLAVSEPVAADTRLLYSP